jgi:hypothetical protein
MEDYFSLKSNILTNKKETSWLYGILDGKVHNNPVIE